MGNPEREDVLGLVYLFSVDKSFYEKGGGIYRISGRTQKYANVSDPEAAGKIIARFGYTDGKFGNFVTENADSFIFRGDVIKDTGLKTIHTYRIVVPPKQPGGVSDAGLTAPLLA